MTRTILEKSLLIICARLPGCHAHMTAPSTSVSQGNCYTANSLLANPLLPSALGEDIPISELEAMIREFDHDQDGASKHTMQSDYCCRWCSPSQVLSHTILCSRRAGFPCHHDGLGIILRTPIGHAHDWRNRNTHATKLCCCCPNEKGGARDITYTPLGW